MHRYAVCFLPFCLLLLLAFSPSVFSQITVDGVEDEEVYTDSVTFSVPSEEGFEYVVLLNDEPVATDIPVLVDQAEYYELSVHRTETETGNEETLLVQFIVRAGERGNSEWGLAPWVPYPEIPSADAEFAGADLVIVCPDRYPPDLELPVIALVEDADGDRVGVNGTVTAAEFPGFGFPLTRGVGFGFLPGQPAAGSFTLIPSAGPLTQQKEIAVEETTQWLQKEGEVTGQVDWGTDARIHVTDDLTIAEGATLSIGEGGVIKIAPDVEITVRGTMQVTGSRARPVVFTPEAGDAPWGGFLLRWETSLVEMEGAIFTGSGADPDWLDDPPDSASSHRHEQCLFYMVNGARATLTDCYIVDNEGQAGHGEDSFLTMTKCLIQRCITSGQYNGDGTVALTKCALIGFPSVTAPFEDEDNDALYLTGGAHTITDCLIGWALDDGVDAGSGSTGSVAVSGCWFESCYHDAEAWSRDREADVADSVTINSGQGIECGHGDCSVTAVRCLSTANLVGARFGDNYDWDYGGFLTVTDSLLLFNKRDVWGRTWDDWELNVDQMEIRNNYLTASNENFPDNFAWDPAQHASRLEPFLPVPDEVVGIGIAVRNPQVERADLDAGVPVRLSTFCRHEVSVGYRLDDGTDVLESGTLVFVPGQTVCVIDLTSAAVEDAPYLQVTLSNPAGADLTGIESVYVLSTLTLIERNAEWRYFDEGEEAEALWREPDFDDSAWESGPAELGYGDDDEATVVEGGPSDDRYPTTYFRHSFVVDDPARYETLEVGLQRDDGAVVYLNGEEVFRSNMPSGAISYSTYADDTADSEDAFYKQECSASLLLPGVNVVAVEVHQANATSSDVSFALELNASVKPPVIVEGFSRGDANGDGSFDISDAVFILLALFSDAETDCADALDVNDDGGMDIADAISMLSYLFAGGDAPPAPFPGPGEDPTEDELTCER